MEKIPGIICVTTLESEKEQESVLDSEIVYEDVKEHSRRVRMSQSAGDDIVAGNKSHRKRKKTKGKKISSATSKYY